ncbi:hypothetical protein C474_20154 [Halogeometricum pallidum JCM 14848]|uniref:Uncharacterized protein n=1 Tax=Halogeometricum pallidum JCM 14848 TaxID=1227487 RepID=M0CVS1_HALPD|nr:hypothetical protein [Halogeometricum pallidum]ELZ26497.1 hypothetical protein C474_20154 [Halogeometricum pallidum JCM 14848]
MTEKRASMKEISHTPPTGETVTNVWERGREEAETEAEATPDSTVAADD